MTTCPHLGGLGTRCRSRLGGVLVQSGPHIPPKTAAPVGPAGLLICMPVYVGVRSQAHHPNGSCPWCRVPREYLGPDRWREERSSILHSSWVGLLGAKRLTRQPHSQPVSAASQMAILCTFFAIVFALYLAPLTISSPCIMEKKDLGPKPALIGHRGAPMVSAT